MRVDYCDLTESCRNAKADSALRFGLGANQFTAHHATKSSRVLGYFLRPKPAVCAAGFKCVAGDVFPYSRLRHTTPALQIPRQRGIWLSPSHQRIGVTRLSG